MNSSDNFQDSALSRLMPLMNSSFTPGQAQATVDNFQDPDQRQIAQAELYYFSGRAEECRNIAELYLQDKDLCLRLSAALLYSFSNLTLGNPSASRMGFRNIQECLLVAKDSSAPKGAMASCVFANYLAMVLMHLPTDGLPPLQVFCHLYLPGFALMLFMSSLITLIFTKNINGRWDYVSLSF